MTTEKPSSMDALKAAQETLRNAAHTLGKIDARGDAQEKVQKDSPEGLVQKVKNMVIAARRINKIWDASQDLYEKVSPYIGPVLKPAMWTASKLKDTFVWSAFERENGTLKRDEDGDPIFSPLRLAKVFAVAATMGVAGAVGVQDAYFNATHFNEMIYVTGKQEIQAGDLYHLTGCTSLPCSTQSDNGKYFQIEQSWYLPHLLYPEQDVYANIPNQLAACNIEGYGIYFKDLKRLFRWTEMYQHVYDVSCRPLSQDEVQKAMLPAPPLPSPHQ